MVLPVARLSNFAYRRRSFTRKTTSTFGSLEEGISWKSSILISSKSQLIQPHPRNLQGSGIDGVTSVRRISRRMTSSGIVVLPVKLMRASQPGASP